MEPCFGLFSSLMLQKFDPDGFSLRYYADNTTARNSVQHGQAWGVIEYPQEFSIDLLTVSHSLQPLSLSFAKVYLIICVGWYLCWVGWNNFSDIPQRMHQKRL
jgi:hypothetical protein